ncbi:hypothetical protein [Robertmurraya korlensis]|uniref:hypothetical protein n=1 Tax=Robertmurraya korlensis TaxID=519977 RepID=UPI00082619AA|nr:hypothetical protein [Robertmurraya korlensis]
MAGILYDNENLPEPIPIQSHHLSKGMELIDVETSFEPYADEIQEYVKGRHWHIGYYDKETEDYIEAIVFKNDQGMWDIFYEDFPEEEELKSYHTPDKSPELPDHKFLFTVKLFSEAEEKFSQFVEDVILKRSS